HTQIYTLSLHDALPISTASSRPSMDGCATTQLPRTILKRLLTLTCSWAVCIAAVPVYASISFTPLGDLPGGFFESVALDVSGDGDRKSTRLNSSHVKIS